jgi:hypothetical protein
LPELADLVERMLVEVEYDLENSVVREGEEREVVAEYLAAREIANLVENGSDQVSPGDVASAIDGLRALAAYVIAERSANSRPPRAAEPTVPLRRPATGSVRRLHA